MKSVLVLTVLAVFFGGNTVVYGAADNPDEQSGYKDCIAAGRSYYDCLKAGPKKE